jgi:hypothetical protein
VQLRLSLNSYNNSWGSNTPQMAGHGGIYIGPQANRALVLGKGIFCTNRTGLSVWNGLSWQSPVAPKWPVEANRWIVRLRLTVGQAPDRTLCLSPVTLIGRVRSSRALSGISLDANRTLPLSGLVVQSPKYGCVVPSGVVVQNTGPDAHVAGSGPP